MRLVVSVIWLMFTTSGSYVYFLADVMKDGGDKDLADKLTGAFSKLIDWAASEGEEVAEPAD